MLSGANVFEISDIDRAHQFGRLGRDNVLWLPEIIIRQGHVNLSNWRNLPRPREKYFGAGPTYNRLNREKEGRREGGGRVCSDELG
jgi:hypothetical protein